MAETNLEDFSKGEEVPKRISPMIASVAELIEATRPTEPQTEGPSASVSIAQSEGEARPEGEQAKRKGKGKDVATSGEKVIEEEEGHVDVPEDLHKKLRQAQLELTRKQRDLEYHEKLKDDTLVAMGMKDTVDAANLGLRIDTYRTLKDHPCIVKALEIHEEIKKRLIILEEEEKLHAASIGVSVDVLKEEKEKAKKKDLTEMKKLVDEAVKSLNKRPRSVSFRTPKAAAEARTDTFQVSTGPITVSEAERSLMIPSVDISKMNAKALEKYNRTKKTYEDIMRRRSGNTNSKIVECFIKINSDQKSFYADIKRADGSRTTKDKALVFDFGYSEWVEMIEALKRKRPSKHESAWIKALQKKIELKEALEEELGIKKPSTGEGSSSGLKRKATEHPIGPSVKRSR